MCAGAGSRSRACARSPPPRPQVFNFYARLFDPRKQLCLRAPTYAQIAFANSTICLGEAVRFARDFRILPQLLTRGDIVCVTRGRAGSRAATPRLKLKRAATLTCWRHRHA